MSHSVERRLVACNGRDEGQGQGNHVHSELELQELLDVVEHRATPHHGLHDGGEVVVQDHDV